MGKEELKRDDAPVSAEEKVSRHFIEKEIDKDLAEGVYETANSIFVLMTPIPPRKRANL